MPSCSQRLLSTTAVLAVLWAGFANAQCYRPDGTGIVLADEGWFQCPTTANGHSQCCGKEEVCMPMGLCGTNGATISDMSKGYWYREYCSDPTWGSSKCSNVCLQSGTTSGTVLTMCEDGSVCCGFKNTNCCDKGEGAFLDSNGRVIKDDEEADPTTTSKATSTTSKASDADPTDASDGDEEDPEESSSSTTTKSATESSQSQVTVTSLAAVTSEDGSIEIITTVFAEAAATPPPSASDILADSQSGGLSGGAAAGIGAGVGILAMLFLGGAIFLWRRKQKNRKQQYYTAGGLPLPAYRAGHQPTDSEDGAYVGGFKPTTTDGAYSAKLAADANHGQGPPPNHSAELPHHYPQQYAHELPPHATGNAVHEMQGEYPVAHEIGIGSPRR